MNAPWHGKKIAVFGDVTADRFADGRATRISNEAPIPVIVVNNRRVSPGCGGNALMNVLSLGAEPLLCAPLGDDLPGQQLRAYLDEHGLTSKFCYDHKQPTTTKTRILAAQQQVARFDEEHPVAELSEQQQQEIYTLLKELRAETDTILVTDYGYNWINPTTLAMITELWANGLIVCDPQAHKQATYPGVHVMKPNLKESMFMTDTHDMENTDAHVEQLGRQLIEKYSMEFVVITRSECGMSLIEKDGDATHLPAHALTITEVSGAGDSVAAMLTVALAGGMSRVEAAELANLAGSVSVSHPGLYHVRYEDIQNLQKAKAA